MANKIDPSGHDGIARKADYSVEACSFRARAAILCSGHTLTSFAKASGQTLTALINSTKGRSYPSRATMLTLYRFHRIDPTFILTGDYAQLPGDIQTRLFEALRAAQSELDQSESTG